MTRTGKRLATGVVAGLLLLALAHCSALKRKAGDKCAANGEFTCSDPNTALLCAGGSLVSMPCRGPKGCTGAGPGSQCDDDLGQAGEPCLSGSSGENYACGVDRKSELVCTSGKWALASSCKGPNGCKVTGLMVHCDDDFADLGDPCVSSASDANYSCTPDQKTIVVCQQNKFVEWEGCYGPKGCHIESNNVYCDTTLGKEGDLCRHADSHACNAEGTSMLHCTKDNKWTKQMDCKRQGCKVKGNEVFCE